MKTGERQDRFVTNKAASRRDRERYGRCSAEQHCLSRNKGRAELTLAVRVEEDRRRDGSSAARRPALVPAVSARRRASSSWGSRAGYPAHSSAKHALNGFARATCPSPARAHVIALTRPTALRAPPTTCPPLRD
eukprot:6173578-Pleurochrysis_carterae.AAC.1